MKFELSKEEEDRAWEFIKTKQVDYCGAIGGQFTFTFTRTSIGQVATVIDNVSKEELTLTDFDEW